MIFTVTTSDTRSNNSTRLKPSLPLRSYKNLKERLPPTEQHFRTPDQPPDANVAPLTSPGAVLMTPLVQTLIRPLVEVRMVISRQWCKCKAARLHLCLVLPLHADVAAAAVLHINTADVRRCVLCSAPLCLLRRAQTARPNM